MTSTEHLDRRCAAAEMLLATLNREHLEEIGAIEAMALVLRFCSARNGRGPLPLYGGLALHLLCCCTDHEPVYKTFDQLDCDALSFQFGADAVEISQELYSAGFPDASATFALSGPETIKVHAASTPLLDLHELPAPAGARTLTYLRRQGLLVDPARADPEVTGAVLRALPAHLRPLGGAPLKLLICPTSWLLRNMANELATPLNVPARKPKARPPCRSVRPCWPLPPLTPAIACVSRCRCCCGCACCSGCESRRRRARPCCAPRSPQAQPRSAAPPSAAAAAAAAAAARIGAAPLQMHGVAAAEAKAAAWARRRWRRRRICGRRAGGPRW